ncbi:MAG: phenylacetate--CoA ligase family protein [Pseudomonadales bacterium]|nr:phenylacetate--CoA ligase family protein [Pseudomonadales bacterium]
MSSLYTKLVSCAIFPLHECLKGHTTVADMRSLEQSQWWSKDEILALQSQRLQKLIRSVNQNVPYYAELLESQNIDPAEIKSAEDLKKLPFLNKALIRANSDKLRARNAKHLSRFNTGGSSGEPLIFYIGKERVSRDVAAKWRATRWWDVDLGDKEIVLWGSPIELGTQDYVRLIRDKLLRTRLLPAFEMSEAKIDSFIQEIKKVKPQMLFGYPSAFSLIAKRAKDTNILLNGLGTKVVFVTSERLYDHQRELLENTFGCPIANGYGGRDAGFIAHQCPQGNMHITAEDIIVEIVDPAGNVLPPGNSGEIVTTHLATQDYPFIRYRTGDIGVLEERNCSCGRGLPILKEIQGRSTDFIVAADGTLMHGLALIYILRDIQSVLEFKIIQESKQLTRVQLVVNSNFSEFDEKQIISGFKKRLGDGVNIVIERVDKIAAEASGKMRYVVSRI